LVWSSNGSHRGECERTCRNGSPAEAKATHDTYVQPGSKSRSALRTMIAGHLCGQGGSFHFTQRLTILLPENIG
jgi:hypothetical protein